MASGRQLRAGRVFVEFGGNDAALQRVLSRASKRISGFGRSLTGIGARLTGLSAAITAPLVAATGIFARTGDQLDKLSRRTGFSVESLSTLRFAAEQSGSSMDTLGRAAKGQANAIQELGRGSATYVDTFDALGLTFQQLSRLSPEDQFKLIADRLAGIENFGERAALSMDIFGRSGQELLPLLEGGAKGIEALQQRARDLNLEIGTDAAEEAAELTDRLNELKRVALTVAFRIGEALGGSVSDVAKRLAEVGARIVDFVRANRALIVTVAKIAAVIGAAGAVLIGLGATFILIGGAISGLVTIIGLATTLFSGLATVIGLIVSPVGIAVAAIVGLGVVIGQTTGLFGRIAATIKSAFGSIVATAGKAFEGVKNALAGGDIQLAVRIVWLAIQVEFQKGIAYVQGLWLDLKRFLVEKFSSTIEIIRSIWDSLVDFFGPSIQLAVNVIGAAIARVREFFVPVVEFIRNVWGKVATFIADAFGSAFGSVGGGGFDLGRSLIQVATGIQGAWAQAITAIQKLWTNLVSFIEKTRQRAIGFATDLILEGQGLIDPAFDVDEAKRISREERESELVKIEEERAKRIEELERALQQREEELGNKLVEFDQRVEQRKRDAQDAINQQEEDAGDRVKSAEEKLAQALEEAAKATEEAGKKQKKNLENAGSASTDPRNGIPVNNSLVTQGIFNTSGIRSLLGSPELSKQTKLSEKQLATQKALLRTMNQRQRVAVWAN